MPRGFAVYGCAFTRDTSYLDHTCGLVCTT